MFEFTIPEDLSQCSQEEIFECLEEAKKEFSLLYESDDTSDEILDRMSELADSVENIYSEFASKKKKEYADKLKKVLHE
jgi:hypothetical protein